MHSLYAVQRSAAARQRRPRGVDGDAAGALIGRADCRRGRGAGMGWGRRDDFNGGR